MHCYFLILRNKYPRHIYSEREKCCLSGIFLSTYFWLLANNRQFSLVESFVDLESLDNNEALILKIPRKACGGVPTTICALEMQKL